MADIIVFHHSNDREAAEMLADALGKLGFEAPAGYDEADFEADAAGVGAATDLSVAGIVLWSPTSRASAGFVDLAALVAAKGRMLSVCGPTARPPLEFDEPPAHELNEWTGDLKHPGLVDLSNILASRYGVRRHWAVSAMQAKQQQDSGKLPWMRTSAKAETVARPAGFKSGASAATAAPAAEPPVAAPSPAATPSMAASVVEPAAPIDPRNEPVFKFGFGRSKGKTDKATGFKPMAAEPAKPASADAAEPAPVMAETAVTPPARSEPAPIVATAPAPRRARPTAAPMRQGKPTPAPAPTPVARTVNAPAPAPAPAKPAPISYAKAAPVAEATAAKAPAPDVDWDRAAEAFAAPASAPAPLFVDDPAPAAPVAEAAAPVKAPETRILAAAAPVIEPAVAAEAAPARRNNGGLAFAAMTGGGAVAGALAGVASAILANQGVTSALTANAHESTAEETTAPSIGALPGVDAQARDASGFVTAPARPAGPEVQRVSRTLEQETPPAAATRLPPARRPAPAPAPVAPEEPRMTDDEALTRALNMHMLAPSALYSVPAPAEDQAGDVAGIDYVQLTGQALAAVQGAAASSEAPPSPSEPAPAEAAFEEGLF